MLEQRLQMMQLKGDWMQDDRSETTSAASVANNVPQRQLVAPPSPVFNHELYSFCLSKMSKRYIRMDYKYFVTNMTNLFSSDNKY